ncbi:hypothetical protein RhiTH_007131 [Rhizoctonia solani]
MVFVLNQHQDKWGSDTHTRVDMYKLRDLESRSMTYDFHGGYYVRGSSLPGMGDYTRRLDVYQLPSVNKNSEWREWTHPDIGVDVRDFVLQTDYDLLVLLEAGEPISDHETTEDSPDALQHIKIHLRSLETGQPHPAAACPVLECQLPSYMQSMCSFYAQVVGRYISVFFQVLAWRGTRSYELKIWDWTTGKLISLILIPCPVTFTDGGLRHQAHLDIYKFDEPSTDDAIAQPAQLIASLYLPEVPEVTGTRFIISRFSCRCDPPPSPSAQIAVPYVGRPKIYDLASNNRVLCVAMEALNIRVNTGGRTRTKSMLYISCADLVDMVMDILDKSTQESTVVTIPWKDWGNKASWVDIGQIYTGNQCYVHGQRTVGLVYARNENIAEDAEEETTRIHSLVIFDFDPVRVKQASRQVRRGVRISDPKAESAWDIPAEETKLMRNLFLAGETKADRLFSVRSTLINEEFHSPYCYVMIDEEHVVIVLQDLGGRKSSEGFVEMVSDDSAELQYLIELYSFGYVAPGNPRRDLLSTEKVQLLKQHQKRWKSTSWTQVDVYPLKKRNLNGDTSTYDYCGGVYAQGSSFPGGQYTRRLDLYQIPSVNKGIPWKQWSFDDLGVDTRDFVMQPEYDLLVLLESNQTVLYPNSAGINEGEPDRTHYFTIHLRTLGTNEPHPDAARPTINYSTPSYRRTTSSFYFQIVGRYLAVQFLVTNASGSDKFKLRVWDWTTGKDVTYIEPWQPGAKTFTFLSDQLILIPCLEVVSTGGVGLLHPRTHGKMAVFTFNEPNDDNPAEGARQIATFELPDSSSPFLYLQGLSCRCDPAPGPSFRSATRHDSRPKLFDLAPESRVLCLKMKSPGVIPIDEMESTLYIQFTDLIDAVTHLLEGPTDKPVLNIPWENWVKGTSWVDTDLLYTGNECYVYGQRVVSVGLDHTDDDSDLNEITAALLRRRSSLCVFDFDPIRNKREILLTESEIEIFYPKTDTVLGTWSDGPSLRNTFVEGEHTADTPFALRKTLINERLDQHYYVMIDDEHILMAQQRHGRESSLIVYSFN